MCKLKLHMVEELKRLRSSQIKGPSTSTYGNGGSSVFSTNTANSLASLRDFLPENPILYTHKESANATMQFACERMGKLSVGKCIFRGKTMAVTVKKQKGKIRDIRIGFRQICNAHHASIVKLLGGFYEGQIIYLAYEYVKGSSLADCLSGSKVPGFTILGSWISRMQIAVDVAQGLEYMHHDDNINYVHNYIKSSSILVMEPGYRARICHMGASYLAREYDSGSIFDTQSDSNANFQARALHKHSSLKIMGT